MFIEGRLKLDTWEKDGKKNSKLKVIGENMQFLGSKPAGNHEAPEPSEALKQQRAQRETAAPRQRQSVPDDDPDDIPFATSIHRDVRNNRLNRRVF